MRARNRPRFEATRRRLLWANGAVAQMFSSEDPESLRGPQFDAAWCDEAGKWKHAEAAFDMLQFGLRLGKLPRQIITTTPRPTRLIKRLMADPTVLVVRMPTVENAANLAPGFLRAVERRYGGTLLARQELSGELIEDREDALWSRAMIEERRLDAVPELGRIVVAVDPPASSRRNSDACGIVAAGLDAAGNAVVIADATLRGARPQDWAARAVALFHSLEADCLVAEVNQGGDMVTAVIRTVDKAVPVKAVRAHRGKWLRAEPVAALYSQGRVRHAGRFAELEDEMCDFGPNGLSAGPLARPRRRAGVGDRRADAALGRRAEGAGILEPAAKLYSGGHLPALSALPMLTYPKVRCASVLESTTIWLPGATFAACPWRGRRKAKRAPRVRRGQRACRPIASALTGVKKLIRLPSGSRNSRERLPHGMVLGSCTKSPTSGFSR